MHIGLRCTHPPAQGDWIFTLFSAASAIGLALLALAVAGRTALREEIDQLKLLIHQVDGRDG